jgi:AbrB family looped-hinge helix DNA binding protein
MEGPKGKHIFGLVKVGERGQIVIPKEAREIFHIQAGDQLMLVGDEESGLAIITSDGLSSFFSGILGEATP